MIRTLTLDKDALSALGHALTATLDVKADAELYDWTQYSFRSLSAHPEILSFNYDLSDLHIQRLAGMLVSLGLPVITQLESE
jgi:hypothetical protein